MRPRHCIACGDLLQPREVEGRQRLACPACGRVAYENPVPAAAVVVRRKDEVLLVRRAIEPRRGRWGLPAGFQEIDETPETAAVRECREETGLVVRLTGLLDVLATHDDPRKTGILVIYTGQEVDGELVPGDDCDEVAFHPLDRLPDDLAFRNDRVILDRLRRGEERPW
jgi:8-oxo-dGTP diphosphatase